MTYKEWLINYKFGIVPDNKNLKQLHDSIIKVNSIGSHGIFVVYDITDRNSFSAI